MRINRLLNLLAAFLVAALAARPASAWDYSFQHGFTGNPYYQARLTAIMQNTDVPVLGEAGRFHAWVEVQEGWISKSSLVPVDEAQSQICSWVAGSHTTSVKCPTPLARDTSVTDGRLYCAVGLSTFKDGRGEVHAELQAGPICTTQSGHTPGEASASANFLGCNDSCARWQFTFWAPRAIRYRIERRPVGGWWSHYETIGGTSHIAHLGGNDQSWRVRGENAVGPGPWTYFNTTGRCNTGGGGGPGGPGPID